MASAGWLLAGPVVDGTLGEGVPLLAAHLAGEVARREQRNEHPAGGEHLAEPFRPALAGAYLPVHEAGGRARGQVGHGHHVAAEILEEPLDPHIGVRSTAVPRCMRITQEEVRPMVRRSLLRCCVHTTPVLCEHPHPRSGKNASEFIIPERTLLHPHGVRSFNAPFRSSVPDAIDRVLDRIRSWVVPSRLSRVCAGVRPEPESSLQTSFLIRSSSCFPLTVSSAARSSVSMACGTPSR